MMQDQDDPSGVIDDQDSDFYQDETSPEESQSTQWTNASQPGHNVWAVEDSMGATNRNPNNTNTNTFTVNRGMVNNGVGGVSAANACGAYNGVNLQQESADPRMRGRTQIQNTTESIRSPQPTKYAFQKGPNMKQPTAIGNETTVPDLDDLKKKVIASMSKSRETSAAPKAASGTAKTQATPVAGRQDSFTDLDSLLAEGKAAAEKGSLSEQSSKKQNVMVPLKAKDQLEVPGRDDSSGPSEQGEIREDEPPKPVSEPPTNKKQVMETRPKEAVKKEETKVTLNPTTRPVKDAHSAQKKAKRGLELREDYNESRKPPGGGYDGYEGRGRKPFQRPDDSGDRPKYQSLRPPPLRSNSYTGNRERSPDLAARRQESEFERRRSDDFRPRARELDSGSSNLRSARLEPNTTQRPTMGDDIEDWLEMTGYHDLAYRKDALRRHRELLALDMKRAAISREMNQAQEERANIARAQSVMAAERPPPNSAPLAGIRSGSVATMPPPPTPGRLGPSEYDIDSISSGPSKRPGLYRSSSLDGQSSRPRQADPSLKRRYIHEADDDMGPSEKFLRGNDGAGRFRIGEMDFDAEDEARSGRPLERRPWPDEERYLRPESMYDDEEGLSPGHGARGSSGRGRYRGGRGKQGHHHFYKTNSNEWDEENGSYGPESQRGGAGNGRGRGRGGRHQAGPSTPIGPRYGRQDTVTDFAFDRGDSRFFIIKSYNHENVLMAQDESVWMTQQHNADIFAEAFTSCRNVIFVFSVNKSMAFQGYARMESKPGDASMPSWAQDLLWKSSAPFRIRWITIAETRFAHVGHLKNAFNENQPVLVARDGQEVEQACATQLCKYIDEEADRYKREEW